MTEEHNNFKPRDLYAAEYDEIDLTELFAVLWRQRKFILSIFLLAVACGIGYAIVAPKQFRIISQVKPGITSYDENLQPVRSLSVKDIEEWFNKKGYLDIAKIYTVTSHPNIKASVSRGANVVTLELLWPNPSEGKDIILKILKRLSDSGTTAMMKRSLTLARANLQRLISSKQNMLERIPLEQERLQSKKELIESQLKVLSISLDNVRKNKKEAIDLKTKVTEQLNKMSDNTREMIIARQALVKNQKNDELALLMYSNIIQQNITYLTNLEQRSYEVSKEINQYEVQEEELFNKKQQLLLQMKDIDLKINKELKMQATQLQLDIKNLTRKIDTLSPIEIVQEPFSTDAPETPKLQMILALSATLGIFLAIIGAFIKEFWDKNKDKITMATSS